MQAHQSLGKATHWVSFIGTPQSETMFAGIYRAKYVGVSQAKTTPTTDAEGQDPVASVHIYETALDPALSEYIGRLFITWDGKRAYIRRVDRTEWPIEEIRRQFSEPAFPGYLRFINFFRSSGRFPAPGSKC